MLLELEQKRANLGQTLLGAIIGKALGALQEGKSKIPVLVMLQ